MFSNFMLTFKCIILLFMFIIFFVFMWGLSKCTIFTLFLPSSERSRYSVNYRWMDQGKRCGILNLRFFILPKFTGWSISYFSLVRGEDLTSKLPCQFLNHTFYNAHTCYQSFLICVVLHVIHIHLLKSHNSLACSKDLYLEFQSQCTFWKMFFPLLTFLCLLNEFNISQLSTLF